MVWLSYAAVAGLMVSVAASGRMPGLFSTQQEPELRFQWQRVEDLDLNPGIAHLLPGLMIFSLFAVVWALLIWRGNPPQRRFYDWAMPVHRGTHELLRVLSGLVWLMAAWFLLLIAGWLAQWLSGRGYNYGALTLAGWANLVSAPLVFYLFASAAALRSRSPGLAFLGAIAGFSAFYALVNFFNLTPFAAVCWAVVYGPYGYQSACFWQFMEAITNFSPNATETQSITASLVWLLLGAGGVIWAAFYPRRM